MGTIRRLMGRPAQAIANTAAPAARWIRSRTRSNTNKVDTNIGPNSIDIKNGIGRPNSPRTREMKQIEKNLRKETIRTYLSNRSTTMDKAKLLDKLATFKGGKLMSEDRAQAYRDDQSDKNALFDAIVSRAADKYSFSDKHYNRFIADLEEHISSNR